MSSSTSKKLSPPRHRHDGTSPLPLGLDASRPPSQWTGKSTIWPHDAGGWSYCAMIPSFTTSPNRAGGSDTQPIVFYRVQVGIQSPTAVSTLRGILRRFSDFLKLHLALKKAFPRKKIAAPPSKKQLRLTWTAQLLEERRRNLEEWLQQLLEDLDMSRSAPVAVFLELEAVARHAAAVSSGDEIPATPTLIPGSNQSALAPSLPSPSNIGSASSSLPESPPSFQDGALFGSATPMIASSDAEDSEAESTAGRGGGRFDDPGRGLGRVTESQSDESVNRGKEAIARAAAARAAVAALKNMSKEGAESGGESMSDLDRSGATPGENGIHTERPEGGSLQTGEETGDREALRNTHEATGGEDGLQIDMAGLPNVRVPSSQPAPSPSKSVGVPRTASLPPHAGPRPSKLGARKGGEVVGTENRGGVAGTSGEAPAGRPLAHRRQLSTSSDISTSSWGVGSEASGLEAFDVHGGGLVAVGEMSKELKLALPLDQRGAVRRMLGALQRRLAAAKADMEDLIARLRQESALTEFLHSKVKDLEGELESARESGRETLRQAITAERERWTAVQWEVEEARVAQQAAEDEAERERGMRQELSEKLEKWEHEKAELEGQLESARQTAEALAAERDALDAQARADKKVLAKEIQKLRKAQPALKEEADAAARARDRLEEELAVERSRQRGAAQSRAALLHEVATLRQKLAESSVERIAKEDDGQGRKQGNGLATDSVELLAVSDNRIGCLLAEAQLLSEEVDPGDPSRDHADEASAPRPEEPGSEAAVRKVLAEVLMDNAQLRRALNSSLRALFTAPKTPLGGEENGVETAKRSGMLSRFLQ
ncbi:Phox (PX) domain-containing protein [Klebsormidium nitens]|uniref:Phox (PX) domain-containing protein n=1 Tax=Klebsormidium nitens TaxID=105231 RepID=A0A1Y1I216_KLENI|nr:Phox (PX) domain-containing protein [Klebsormidium nitens]|eukprot:GAQ83479.1 Phox (PX) domain-containing protein [Klebsormidium nitens]